MEVGLLLEILLVELTSVASEIHAGNLGQLRLLKQLSAFSFHHCVIAEPMPELETNFEEFVFVNVTELDHILQTLLDRAAHNLNI